MKSGGGTHPLMEFGPVPDCQNNCSTSSSSTVTPSISIILSTSQPIGIPEFGAWTIMEQIASVVGIASALVGAAFACAKWKRKMNSTSTSAIQTTVARSTDMTSSTLTASATVRQSTNVCNTNAKSTESNARTKVVKSWLVPSSSSRI